MVEPVESGVGHIVLVGLPGTGKSTLAANLAERLGLPSVDTDRMVERRRGATVAEVFEREGEAAFREVESEMLAEVLAGPASVVATGGGAVLAAGNRRLLRERATVVWLRADPDELERRVVASPESRPLLRDDPAAALRRLAVERDPLYREVADLVVDTTAISRSEVVDVVVSAIVEQR